jgi:transglutaminase-like putative cysteine protease
VTTYRITHRTEYRYESEVSSSYGEMHLLPRDLDSQTCRSSSVTIEPPPHELHKRADFFGNRTAYFSILVPHTNLTITTTSVVEVDSVADLPMFAAQPWEAVRDALRAGDDVDAVQFALDSPLVPASAALAELAAPSFTAGRPVLEAVAALSHRIHDEFAYEPGATNVRTTVEEVLARRAGVCQDFAHLLIGCLRSLGLAARYVSGYLETDPPPGRDRLQGADRSHAWASVWLPGSSWIDVDPTNDRFVGPRHVTTAWGRDYGDVPPLKGVIYTEGVEHELSVKIDVVALDG